MADVTPQMVDAGFEVLRKSGLADEYLDADKLVVVEIFQAMIALADERHQYEALKAKFEGKDGR